MKSFLLVILIIIFITGCNSAVPTHSPTPTSTKAAIATSTPTLAPPKEAAIVRIRPVDMRDFSNKKTLVIFGLDTSRSMKDCDSDMVQSKAMIEFLISWIAQYNQKSPYMTNPVNIPTIQVKTYPLTTTSYASQYLDSSQINEGSSIFEQVDNIGYLSTDIFFEDLFKDINSPTLLRKYDRIVFLFWTDGKFLPAVGENPVKAQQEYQTQALAAYHQLSDKVKLGFFFPCQIPNEDDEQWWTSLSANHDSNEENLLSLQNTEKKDDSTWWLPKLLSMSWFQYAFGDLGYDTSGWNKLFMYLSQKWWYFDKGEPKEVANVRFQSFANISGFSAGLIPVSVNTPIPYFRQDDIQKTQNPANYWTDFVDYKDDCSPHEWAVDLAEPVPLLFWWKSEDDIFVSGDIEEANLTIGHPDGDKSVIKVKINAVHSHSNTPIDMISLAKCQSVALRVSNKLILQPKLWLSTKEGESIAEWQLNDLDPILLLTQEPISSDLSAPLSLLLDYKGIDGTIGIDTADVLLDNKRLQTSYYPQIKGANCSESLVEGVEWQICNFTIPYGEPRFHPEKESFGSLKIIYDSVGASCPGQDPITIPTNSEHANVHFGLVDEGSFQLSLKKSNGCNPVQIEFAFAPLNKLIVSTPFSPEK